MESQAFMEITEMTLRGEMVIVSSDYVKFEIEQILDPLKRKDVKGFERTLSSVNVTSSEQLIALTREFSAKCGVNSLDALHLSATCVSNAHFFLTCDDEILLKKVSIEKLAAEKRYRLKVRNPVKYIKEKQR